MVIILSTYLKPILCLKIVNKSFYLYVVRSGSYNINPKMRVHELFSGPACKSIYSTLMTSWVPGSISVPRVYRTEVSCLT